MDMLHANKTLLHLESPFSWNVPVMDQPINHYIMCQEEKIKNTGEETNFKWTQFNLDLLLAYELYDKKKDFTAAFKHINSCATNLENALKENCQEQLFCSIKTSLMHVTYTTMAHLLMLNGQIGKVQPLIDKITPVIKMTKREKAGIFGIQAGMFIQYGTSGHRKALEYAKKAREMDPVQAEWHFIVGNAIGRIRRVENGKISNEEVEAIEKAFCLEENATYIVHLATLYSERSNSLFYDTKDYRENQENGKIYAVKATKYFRKAIEMRPNCSSIKARAAHGLLRIRFKEVMDIKFVKKLLDEVVQLVPNNSMAYHDLGMYYEKFENNTNKAIECLKKADELYNIKALLYMVTLKWRHANGLERQIIRDLENSLVRYPEKESQAELLSTLAYYALLISNDWPSALKYVNRCLKVDQSAQYLLECSTLRFYKTNMLQMITQELCKKPELKVLTVSEEYFELIKGLKYDTSSRVTNYTDWKRDQLKSVIRRRY